MSKKTGIINDQSQTDPQIHAEIIDRYLTLNLKLSSLAWEEMVKQNISTLELASMMEEDYEIVAGWFTGMHDFSLTEISKLEAGLGIELISIPQD